MTNGALPLVSWKCQEGWVMGQNAQTNQGGEPVAEADLRAEGPALTFIYIARSTYTPGKFSVLIWASGLCFIIFLNHPPLGSLVNKTQRETPHAGLLCLPRPGFSTDVPRGHGRDVSVMHEGFCWDVQHGPACLGCGVDTALECEIRGTRTGPGSQGHHSSLGSATKHCETPCAFWPQFLQR